MKESDYISVYTTFSSAETARKVAGLVIDKRLAACTNIIPAIESLYIWDGNLTSDLEVAAFFKTTASNFESLRQLIVDNHPYSCPCIVALPIVAGHEPYLKWLSESTS